MFIRFLVKLAFVVVCFFASSVFAAETLTVAVASSLYATLKDQAPMFEKTHGVHLQLVAGSTGRLYHQIQLGAPFDVFIAAEKKQPEQLIQSGKAMASSYTLGYGYLGLIIHHQQYQAITRLLTPNIHRIVIANPNVAPFGKACKKLLQQKNLWQRLKPKFVYAQNAMQASMMVDQGLVDAGFIPVEGSSAYLLRIPYIGVLLSERAVAKQYLNFIQQHD